MALENLNPELVGVSYLAIQMALEGLNPELVEVSQGNTNGSRRPKS